MEQMQKEVGLLLVLTASCGLTTVGADLADSGTDNCTRLVACSELIASYDVVTNLSRQVKKHQGVPDRNLEKEEQLLSELEQRTGNISADSSRSCCVRAFFQDVGSALEELRSLLKEQEEILLLSDDVDTKIRQYEDFHSLALLIGIVDDLKTLKMMHEASVQHAEKFQDMLTNNSALEQLFESTNVSELVDPESWQLQLTNATTRKELFEKRLCEQKALTDLYESAEYWLLGLMFLLGISGNGILLLIFCLNREMRSVPNLMLINLAVTDTTNLLVNIPVFYITDGRLDNFSCKLFQFVRTLCVGVSVYSVVTISVQRFLAISAGYRATRLKTVSMVVLVWVVAALVAAPHAALAGLKEDGSCYGTQSNEPQYRRGITLFDVILLCLAPVFLITVFSGIAADSVRTSVRHVPGEAAGHGSLKKTRVLSSNVLLGLVFVFAISFVPFYLFKFVLVWARLRLDPLLYGYVLIIVYSLIFVNSCLNPVALYVLSKRFRTRFNRYLLCGFVARSDSATSHTSNVTLESTSL